MNTRKLIVAELTQEDRAIIQMAACRKANREIGRDWRTQGQWHRVRNETLARMRSMAESKPVRPL